MTMQAAFAQAIKHAADDQRCKLFKDAEGWHVVLN